MVGHEITHVLEGTELYTELQSAITEYAKSKGDYQGRYDTLTELYKDIEGADIDAELTADLVGDYLFTDADFVQRLSTEHRNVFQKLFDEIKHLCKLATAGTKEARELEKIKKLFEDAYRAETKNPTADGGVKYALESKTQQGKLDPRTVTKDDVLALLRQVEDGSISGNTYIPLRIGTPQILIYWADKRNGDSIDNNPIAISADKAHNAMNRNGETSENGGRPNRLTADEIVAMVENMNDPEYIVYQGGNDRYVEVVKFNRDNGDSAFAVLEIGNNKDAVYMNGYEGGLYNILVTTYPPITGKLKELLNGSQNKVIYDKKKDASQRTSSSTVPSVLNDASFYEDIISEPSAGVKEEKTPSPVYSISGNEQAAAPAGGYRITGEDIALAPTKEYIAEQEIATAPAALRNDVDAEELGAPTREDILQMEMERELYGDWRMSDPLDRKVEKLYRLMLREKISEEEYNAQLVKADRQYQQRGSRVEDALERIREAYSTHQAVTADESAVKQKEVEAVLGEKGAYVSKQANALYDEVKSMQKGKRVSNTLSYLLDTLDLSEEHKAESYNSLRTALLNIRDNPNQVVTVHRTVAFHFSNPPYSTKEPHH